MYDTTKLACPHYAGHWHMSLTSTMSTIILYGVIAVFGIFLETNKHQIVTILRKPITAHVWDQYHWHMMTSLIGYQHKVLAKQTQALSVSSTVAILHLMSWEKYLLQPKAPDVYQKKQTLQVHPGSYCLQLISRHNWLSMACYNTEHCFILPENAI